MCIFDTIDCKCFYQNAQNRLQDLLGKAKKVKAEGGLDTVFEGR